MSTLEFEYYPFDPTGTATTNTIKKEPMVLTASNYRDYHYVIPRFAPFFDATLVVRIRQNGATRVLQPGRDYYVAHKFRDASLACAKDIFGSISFVDTNLAGTLELDYQTIGGKWNITEEVIAAILAEEARNPRIITWETIVNPPWRFPIIDHEWDLVDLTGMKDVKEAVDAVTEAIFAAKGDVSENHVARRDNPHVVTKFQVGLGFVENYRVATVSEAQQGVINNAYMTPARTATAITVLAGQVLTAHTTNINNPHGTNKAQIGLDLVENYRVATNQEALDGTFGQAYMTPILTRAAINASQGSIGNHVTNMNNPHGVDKSQVGLGLVQNFSIANLTEAEAGVRNDRYMTPATTRSLVLKYVTTELDAHATATDNPHKVDKDQVGLSNVMNYAIATPLDMSQGYAIDKYVTPFLVQKKLEEFVPVLINGHVNDEENPHNTTASQVGAYTRDQVDLRFTNYMLKSDTATDSTKWGGESHTSYRDWLYVNMPSLSAAMFDGRTYDQVREEILLAVDDTFLMSEYHQPTDDELPDGQTIPFAVLDRVRVDAADLTSAVSTLDRMFVVTGANARGINTFNESHSVMIVASVRQAKDDPPVVRAHPFYSSELPAGMKIGYAWDTTAEKLTLFLVTASGSDAFNVIDLSGQTPNNSTPPPRIDGELSGLTYVDVTPAPFTVSLDEFTAVKNNLDTATQSILDLTTSLTELTDRVTALEEAAP